MRMSFPTRSSSRSMRMRRRPRPEALVVAAAFVALAAVAAVLARTHHAASRPAATFTWRGIVGDVRPPVSLGQRMIVVLRTPSVAQRVARAHGATRAQERRWTSQVYAVQHEVLTTLAAHGLTVQPDYTFARVLDGFSAPLDPRAVALLDGDPRVLGIFPVRAAFPATISARATALVFGPPIALPGFDGLGVKVAFLATGVGLSPPSLHGRVLAGVDVLGAGGG